MDNTQEDNELFWHTWECLNDWPDDDPDDDNAFDTQAMEE